MMYIENLQLKNNIITWLIIMFFIISFMIVVGGLTRLTDSGLSITQWQLFSGFLPPFNSSDWDKYDEYAKKWSPYRSIACLHLWKSVD